MLRRNPNGFLQKLSATLKEVDLKGLIEGNCHEQTVGRREAEDCPSCSALFTVSKYLLNDAVVNSRDKFPSLYNAGDEFAEQLQLWSAASHQCGPELLSRVLLDVESKFHDLRTGRLVDRTGQQTRLQHTTRELGDRLKTLLDLPGRHGVPAQHQTSDSASCLTCKEARATAAELSQEISKLDRTKPFNLDYCKLFEGVLHDTLHAHHLAVSNEALLDSEETA